MWGDSSGSLRWPQSDAQLDHAKRAGSSVIWGPDGIHVDVAAAAQHVGVTIDQAGLVSKTGSGSLTERSCLMSCSPKSTPKPSDEKAAPLAGGGVVTSVPGRSDLSDWVELM